MSSALDDVGPVSRFVRQLPNPVIRFGGCADCRGHHFYLFVKVPRANVYARVEPFYYDLARGPAE